MMGPALGIAVYILAGSVLDISGRLALATVVWILTWWITQPVPWGISALIPLALFPVTGLLSFEQTVALYGQPVLFWIVSVVLLGYALDKYGFARRCALRLMSVTLIRSSVRSAVFGYMFVVWLISTVISDAATIAMMLPVGMSVAQCIRPPERAAGSTQADALSLQSGIALATLYASVAGGVATMAGAPQNAVIAGFLTKGWTPLDFLAWMRLGVPMAIGLLLVFYVVVMTFVLPRGCSMDPNWSVVVQDDAEGALGPLSRGERNTLLVFGLMVLLWLLPGLSAAFFGTDLVWVQALNNHLPVWVVPVIGLIVLFCLPAEADGSRMTVGWKEFLEHGGWNVAFLATGGVVMGTALTRFGVIGAVVKAVPLEQMPGWALMIGATAVMVVMTNFVSGTAMVSILTPILLPVLANGGYSAAAFAISLSATCIGIALPWAGAAAGTATAGGKIQMRAMVRYGVIASGLNFVMVSLLNLASAFV